MLDIFPSAFSIIAPLIGGLVILFFGFGALFVLGLVFLMAAALPLFVTKDVFVPFKFSLRVKGFNRKVAVSLVSYNSLINDSIWPIFIFGIVGSVAALGGIMALSVFVGFVTTWIVGWMCDRGYRKKMLDAGSVTQSALWILRALVTTFVHVISLESVWRFVSKFVDVSYNSAYYERAKKSDKKLEFSVLREMCIHSSIVPVFVLMLVFYSQIPSMAVMFLIAATGPLFGMLIER